MMKASKLRLNQVTLALALASASSAYAVGNGTIAAGQGSINKNGSTTVVNQQTGRMVVNWDNMDVGKDEALKFNQPGANAAVLNRINAADPTQIQGALSANGQVFIVNPNGVLIGQGASINVGSLIASSLDIDDSAFMAGGKNLQFSGDGEGKVSNEGDITASGSVVLMGGGEVSNQGNITTRNGNIALAAGKSITLSFPSYGGISVKVNSGSLKALVKNGGLLIAKNGSVKLTAWAIDELTRSVINNTGVVEANGLFSSGGDVYLVSEGTGGTLDIAGSVSGNTVKASADSIDVKDGALVHGDMMTDLTARAKGGYVKIGDATIQGGARENTYGPFHGMTTIQADNVLSNGSGKAPKFDKTIVNIYAASEDQNLTIGKDTASVPETQGEGVISRDIVKAAGNTGGGLQVTTVKGNMTVEGDADSSYGDLWLNSQSGDVTIAQSLNGTGLDVNTGGAFRQNADVTMANSVNVNANNIEQAAGASTTARDVSYRGGQDVALNGNVDADSLSLYAGNSFTQGETSALQANRASLYGGDFTMTAGSRKLDNLYFQNRSLNTKLSHATNILSYSMTTGDLKIASTEAVNVDNGLSAGGKMEISAKSLSSTPYHQAWISGNDDITLNVQENIDQVASVNAAGKLSVTAANVNAGSLVGTNGVDVTAQNDINTDYVQSGTWYKVDPEADIKLTGNNINAGQIQSNGNVTVDAAGAVNLTSVDGYDIAIQAAKDLNLADHAFAQGSLSLSGENVNASANGYWQTTRLTANKGITVTAQNDINVQDITNGDIYYYDTPDEKSDVTLTGNNVTAGNIQSGGDVTINAQGAVNLDAASGETVTIKARDNIEWTSIVANIALNAISSEGSITYETVSAPEQNLDAAQGVIVKAQYEPQWPDYGHHDNNPWWNWWGWW